MSKFDKVALVIINILGSIAACVLVAQFVIYILNSLIKE